MESSTLFFKKEYSKFGMDKFLCLVYAYCNNAFPRHQGEISSLINLARTLGGFAVAYYQVPWATKHGALQTFGCEAAVVAGLFILIIPLVQLKGRSMREKYSI